MAKDPAFLFYPGDWLGGTMTFSRAVKGAYMDLLMCQFNQGHLSLQDVKDILGSDFDTMWEKKLKSKFKPNESGGFYNERLEQEVFKRRKFVLHQQKNGSKGGRPKKETQIKPVGLPNETQNLPKQKPLENENDSYITNALGKDNTGSEIPKDRGVGKGKDGEPEMVSEDDGIAASNELVRKMVSAYKKVHPKYRENIHGDTMWCLSIAEFIASDQQWPSQSVLNGKMEDVVDVWLASLEKSKSNNYWFTKTIKSLSDADTWQQFSQFVDFKHLEQTGKKPAGLYDTGLNSDFYNNLSDNP